MLEKTVLQQLQEIFPMEVNREEADAGEKIRLRNDEQKVEIDFILDGRNKGMGIRILKPIIVMSMKPVIFLNMDMRNIRNKSKRRLTTIIKMNSLLKNWQIA